MYVPREHDSVILGDVPVPARQFVDVPPRVVVVRHEWERPAREDVLAEDAMFIKSVRIMLNWCDR